MVTYVLVTIGIRRRAGTTRRVVRTTRVVRLVDVVERVAEDGAATPCRGTVIGAGATRCGTAICGKRAAGALSAGSDTGSASEFTSALIAAPIAPAYGIDSAMIPAIPNQNRWRRVPSPLRPKA